MFKTKSKSETALPPSSVSIIGAGNIFSGDLECNGDLRIDGTVKGNIYSKAKVIIGESGFAEGDIHCNEADVSGRVTGSMFTKAGVILKESAVVTGDIQTNKIIIEPSAKFNGKCTMNSQDSQEFNDRVDHLLKTPESTLLLSGEKI